MTWKRQFRNGPYPERHLHGPSSFRTNPRCFIRRDHECGKVFGASKSCFIACPTDDDLEPTLELMSEKLMKHQFEPVIAVKERAYGQDIFCVKICGKIIESRFCIVVLDDSIKGEVNIPNPNVYYEYGLMTSLRKHIIPLQKEGQTLAFNIQSYDTIKYAPKNLSAEIEEAIRDAIRITEVSGDEGEAKEISDKAILRKLEVAGFVAIDYDSYLRSVLEDTLFRSFTCDRAPAYLYLGKIDTETDIKDYLEDVDVVLVRSEKKAAEKKATILRVESEHAEAKRQAEPRFGLHLGYKLQEAVDRLPADRKILERMNRIYIGFLVNPELRIEEFKSKAAKAVGQYERFYLVFSEDNVLRIGDIAVDIGKHE